MHDSLVHDQLEATSTYPWRAADPPPTVYLKGAETPGTPVLPSLTTKQPQQLVLAAAAPAIRRKPPACLGSRTQSAPPMHEKTPRWLVLTATPVPQTKAMASVSPGWQRMSPVVAATTHAKVHDRVLEPFALRAQTSFSSLGVLVLEDVQGRNTGETPWLLLN